MLQQGVDQQGHQYVEEDDRNSQCEQRREAQAHCQRLLRDNDLPCTWAHLFKNDEIKALGFSMTREAQAEAFHNSTRDYTTTPTALAKN